MLDRITDGDLPKFDEHDMAAGYLRMLEGFPEYLSQIVGAVADGEASSELSLPPTEVFESRRTHFRMRANFGVWREGVGVLRGDATAEPTAQPTLTHEHERELGSCSPPPPPAAAALSRLNFHLLHMLQEQKDCRNARASSTTGCPPPTRRS